MDTPETIEVSKFTKYSCIPGMLTFGTATVVIQKIVLTMRSYDNDGNKEQFSKPWFQTEAMFVGMMLCLVVYEITECVKRFRKVKQEEGTKSRKRDYVLVLIPALCDMCATCMMNVGLVWIQPSIWQMLRGSMIIFSSIMTYFCLKRKLKCYKWVAVIITVVGLLVVAVASLNIPTVNNDEDDDEDGDSTDPDATPRPKTEVTTLQMIIAFVLVIGAQIIQASQIVIEEHLLKSISMPASLIVGIEGFWGTFVLALIMIPLGYTPESWDVFHEDTVDSFELIGHSSTLAIALVLYVFAILAYNLFGMMVTQTFTAVHRTIMEGIRTSCIWLCNLFIHYVIDEHFGEIWNYWSFLELFGFGILIFGTLVYNEVIPLPLPCDKDKGEALLANPV